MCLYDVTEGEIDEATGRGWKIISYFFPHEWTMDWKLCDSKPIQSDTEKYYQSGFHILTDRDQAEEYLRIYPSGLLVEVEWRHQLAKGYEICNWKYDVIVAKEARLVTDLCSNSRTSQSSSDAGISSSGSPRVSA